VVVAEHAHDDDRRRGESLGEKAATAPPTLPQDEEVGGPSSGTNPSGLVKGSWSEETTTSLPSPDPPGERRRERKRQAKDMATHNSGGIILEKLLQNKG
jgi:hypothetical protein